MQIPTGYGVDLFLLFSVGLATIGVCVFCAACFGSRTFYFLEVKKMKKIWSLLVCVLVLSLLFSGCDTLFYDSSASTEEDEVSTELEEEFYDLVCETQELLDIVADDIYNYWYDCIYEDKYREDITYAVACAKADNEENLETIEANTEEIKDLYKEIKGGELKSEVKAVMQAYNDYYALVVEVSGSFNSYSESKEDFKKKLSSALSDLSFELD